MIPKINFFVTAVKKPCRLRRIKLLQGKNQQGSANFPFHGSMPGTYNTKPFDEAKRQGQGREGDSGRECCFPFLPLLFIC